MGYWHKVEFFQPYDLQEKIDRRVIRYCLYPKQIVDSNLPWLDPYALHIAGGNAGRKYRFYLYLGLFDKSELTKLAKKLIDAPQNEWEKIDWEERLEQEGKTCFAKLRLDHHGTPDWTRFSISTLPWALGQLQKGQLDRIDHAAYEKDLGVLHEYLHRIQLKKMEKNLIFDAHALLNMLQGLFNWAQFVPENQPLVAIELREYKALKKERLLPLQVPISIGDLEEIIEQEEPDIGILNSFYIRDLERVMHDGHNETPLTLYLSGPVGKRLNLETPQGSAHILNILQPKYAPLGNWPKPKDHQLNLMQQFALNTIFDYLKDGGLFSINGPPGTGKTTLVREIVAENLVKRAEALAQLDKPQDAFVKKETISFGYYKQATISHLHPSLTGFEMLIASSNNTAVENISKELPLRKNLACPASYLEPVANKIAATHTHTGKIKPLKREEKCWGLISVALGKLKNCRAFLERGFILKSEENSEYQTIWEWSKSYKGSSFNQAKKVFHDKLKELNKIQASLIEFSELHLWLPKTSKDTFCRDEIEQLEHVRCRFEKTNDKKSKVQEHLESLHQLLQLTDAKLESISAIKPPLYSILFERKRWRVYASERDKANKERIYLIDEIRKFQDELSSLNHQFEHLHAEVQTLQGELQNKKIEYEKLLTLYTELKIKFQDIPIPPSHLSLKEHSIHTQSFWQNSHLNQLRSELFVAAMTLHEAWLAAVIRKGGGFGGNLFAIGHLLAGKFPTIPDSILPIWQSLFMIVPVVSSTFASISRLLKGISASQLGWLIIDEAGQAIPQAAVGAIWRSKRIVIMGDPQQIEPVMTVPPSLVDCLGKLQLGDDFVRWSPTQVSVQKLSDEANPFGIYLSTSNNETWVGSPLRVHRRCRDPMFSLANEIAYDHGMVKTELRELHLPFQESCWYHISGMTSDKQYVSEHGNFILEQLQRFYETSGTLPNLYIISPFRRVKDRIKSLILDHGFTQKITKQELRQWIQKRIGTVHTFQGKEEEIVFFVLGADDNSEGSVSWASRKPNLLNVAVTRAKQRLYIVGDVKLWGQKPYFQVAAQKLPIVSVDKVEL